MIWMCSITQEEELFQLLMGQRDNLNIVKTDSAELRWNYLQTISIMMPILVMLLLCIVIH